MTGGRRFNLDPSRFSTVAMTDDHRREVRRTTAQAANHTRSLVMVTLDDIAPTPEPFNSRTQYDDASIGHWASHGCIRMHIPDSMDLFERVQIGTRVIVVW